MFLKFIGNGSAFNTKAGNSCAYFEKDENLYLIDCGEDVFAKIKDKLSNYKSISVFITHTHSDHTGSLPTLCLYCYFVLHIKVKIYCSDDYVVNILKNTGTYDYVDIRHNCKDEINYEFIPTTHVNEISSYGIWFSEHKVYYSGDSNDLILFKDVKEYYQDTCIANYPNNVHLNIDKLDKLITELNLNKDMFILYHFDNEECINRALELGYKISKREE